MKPAKLSLSLGSDTHDGMLFRSDWKHARLARGRMKPIAFLPR
jgi:hypothetical protein